MKPYRLESKHFKLPTQQFHCFNRQVRQIIPSVESGVAITGIGAVCALGSSRGEIVSNLRECRSGIAVKSFGHGLDIPFGEVPLDVTDAGDRAPVFAEHAVRACLNEAQFDIRRMPPHRIGVLVSSSKGLIRNLLNHVQNGQNGAAWDNWTADKLGLGIAKLYDISGPVLNYPAACASGTVSMISAVHLLLDGIIDAALVGSAEASGNALLLAGFRNMGALSPGLCRPFDRRRCGFHPGEGAGIFLLERESDARRRGAAVQATIHGWDYRSDAHHMTGIEPSGRTLEYSISQTLNRAQWHVEDVDYINAHGTGTPLNDKVEAETIGRVFGSCPVPVSSFKSATGHLLGACSSVELALTIMCAAEGFLPPTLNLEEAEFDLSFIMGKCLSRRPERILKTSLGFGGHIASLAVGTGPE
jgi:3-oxoacyl-[acyl-carrier-protein] synthase II